MNKTQPKGTTPVVTISGKHYNVEIVNGEPYINNMSIPEFMKTLTPAELMDTAVVGSHVVDDTINNVKNKRSPQKMFNELHQSKNN
jgi:hypothetical protein